MPPPIPRELARIAAAQVSTKRPTSILLRDRRGLAVSSSDRARQHLQTYEQWQADAKIFSRTMGVARFSANIVAGACGRCDLLVEEQTSDGDWTPTENRRVKGLMAEYGNDLLGQNANELVKLHGWHYNVAGEGALATFNGRGATATTPGAAEWLVLSLDAIEWDQPTKGQAMIKLHPTGTVREGTALVVPRDYVLRFWTPDEEWLGLAVSPMTAGMDDLYRYRSLVRHARKQAESFIAMNGVLWTPQEAHETEAAEDGAGGAIDADEPQHDRTLESYNDWARISIANDDRMESIAPPMWWWEGNEPPKWVEIGRPFDENGIAYRHEALEDWARGVDLPASIIAGGGPGDKNHWVEWLVDEKFFKSAVAPTMDKVTHQDLTVAYLIPRLRLIGEDESRFRVGYDATEVIVHPDMSDKALRGWLAGLVGAVPALRAMGFDPEELATPEDLARLAKVLQGFAQGAPGGPLGPGMPPSVTRGSPVKNGSNGVGPATTDETPPSGPGGEAPTPPAQPRVPAAALLAQVSGLDEYLPPARTAASMNGGSDGVMVALPVAGGAQAETVPDGEPADDLHMTLLYLGKTDELDPSARQVLAGICAGLAEDFAAPEVDLTHLERFAATDGEGLEPCAMVDAGPDCMELRERLNSMATAAGLPVRDDHAFRAHVTLGYWPPGEGPQSGPLPENHAYAPDALMLHWGDEVDAYPFVVAPEPGALPQGAATAAAWDESLHPRDTTGRFSTSPGSGSTPPGPDQSQGELGEAVSAWVLGAQDGGSTRIAREARTEAETAMAEDRQPEGRAGVLVAAIEDSPPLDRTAYRGVALDGTPDEVLEEFQPGDRVRIALGSSSFDETVAAKFAQWGRAEGGTGGFAEGQAEQPRTEVVYEVHPGGQGLLVDYHVLVGPYGGKPTDGYFEAEHEVLLRGSYVVSRAEKFTTHDYYDQGAQFTDARTAVRVTLEPAGRAASAAFVDGSNVLELPAFAELRHLDPRQAAIWDESNYVRDEHGRFALKPGAELPAPQRPADTPEGDAEYRRINELWDRAKAAGGDETPAGKALNNEAFAASEAARVREAQWKADVMGAVSTGAIPLDQARERWGDRLDWIAQEIGGDRWLPLPDQLWHVTTARDAVDASGRLLTREELDQQFGHGLGGGRNDTVSLTDDPSTAAAIRDAVLEAHDYASGERTLHGLVQRAEDGSDAQEPYLADAVRYWRSDWQPGDPYPPGLQKLLDAEDAGTLTASQRLDTYKNFVPFRELHGGPMDPLFFLADADALAAMDPSQVAVGKFVPVPGAAGVKTAGLGEWRVPTGNALRLAGWDVGIESPEQMAQRLAGEGRTAAADWDPGLHPRDLAGRFSTVPTSAEIAAALAEDHAEEISERVAAIEPQVTAALRAALPEGADLVGLEFRRKSEERLAEKLEDKLEQGMTPAEAVASIKDALRYTVADDPADYTGTHDAVTGALTAAGFRQLEAKNYWGPGDAYDGLNTVWSAPDGQKFELQFHTPESHALKEAQHPVYAEMRTEDDPAERQRLFDQMVANWDAVEQPPGVERIGRRLVAVAAAAAPEPGARYWVLVEPGTDDTPERPGGLVRWRPGRGLVLELLTGDGWRDRTRALLGLLVGEDWGDEVPEGEALALERTFPWPGARTADVAEREYVRDWHGRFGHGERPAEPPAEEPAPPADAITPPTAAELAEARRDSGDTGGSQIDLAAQRAVEGTGYYRNYTDVTDAFERNPGVPGLVTSIRNEYVPEQPGVAVFTPLSTDHFYERAGSGELVVDAARLEADVHTGVLEAIGRAEAAAPPAAQEFTEPGIAFAPYTGATGVAGVEVQLDPSLAMDRNPGTTADERRALAEAKAPEVEAELADRGYGAAVSFTTQATQDWHVGGLQLATPEGYPRTMYGVLSGVNPEADTQTIADEYERVLGEVDRRTGAVREALAGMDLTTAEADAISRAGLELDYEVTVSSLPSDVTPDGTWVLPAVGVAVRGENDDTIYRENAVPTWDEDGRAFDPAVLRDRVEAAAFGVADRADEETGGGYDPDHPFTSEAPDQEEGDSEWEARMQGYDEAYSVADAHLQGAFPEDWAVERDGFGEDAMWMIVDPDGNTGRIEATIEGKTLNVGLMEFDEAMQGHGAGTAAVGALVAAAETMGADAISFYANISVGGYAWARMGAYPTESSWPGLRNNLESRLDIAHASGVEIPEAAEREALELLAGPRTNLPAIAALDTMVTVPPDFQQPGGYELRTDTDGRVELGKALLLGTSWQAVVPIGDPAARTDFAEYAAEKPLTAAADPAAPRRKREVLVRRRRPIGTFVDADGLYADAPFWEEVLGGIVRQAGVWNEALHPRERGRFAEKAGGEAVRDTGERTGLWHLTSDPNFRPDPHAKPDWNSLAGDLMGDARPEGVFVGDPEYWMHAHGYERPYVAEIVGDVTDPPGAVMHQGREHFVQGDDMHTARVLTIDEYAREHYHEPGWVEEWHDPGPSAGPGSLRDRLDLEGYEARTTADMTPAELDEYERRFAEYAGRPEGPNPAPARAGAIATWDPELHPRELAGSEHGGRFTKATFGGTPEPSAASPTGTAAFAALEPVDGDALTAAEDRTVGAARTMADNLVREMDDVTADADGFTVKLADGTTERHEWGEADEAVAQASSSFGERGTHLSILLDPEDFKQVLDDGRFKNQFESGDSNGQYAPDWRKKVEDVQMGVPEDQAPADRPIYATFAMDAEYPGAVGHYGSVVCDLKGDVTDRATYTIGDSLDTAACAAKFGETDTGRLLAAVGSAGFAGEVVAGWVADVTGDDSVYPEGSWTDGEYPEAQIHGGLSLDDVERVYFGFPQGPDGFPEYDTDDQGNPLPPTWKDYDGTEHPFITPEITAALDARGIPWSTAW